MANEYHLPLESYKRRAKTDYIAIHCSATPASADIGVERIREMHIKERGWQDVGYHYVIRRDGVVQYGRPQWAIGAHVEGMNSVSVGVCLIGGVDSRGQPVANFTEPQWDSLRGIVHRLRMDYPDAVVQGHRDFPGVKKACPCFDARAWAETLPA